MSVNSSSFLCVLQQNRAQSRLFHLLNIKTWPNRVYQPESQLKGIFEMKLANCERYCIQFQKYDHIFDGQCRVKIKRLHLKGLGEGGLFSKLSDHLFVTYTRTYIKCPVVSLQFRRLLRAKLRFKHATVTLSGRPCLIKSWSGRCGKGVGKNVKSIAPPLPNPLNPSPRRGDELVVWSLQTEDQTEKDSTFYHIVCSNVGKEANIHPRNLANFKVRSFTK